MSGTLYLVATPIGNLEDITIRAKNTLASVNLILAEDTRTTGNLLSKLGITTRMRAYHDHNEVKAAPAVVRDLLDGQDIALVSDAGTPVIADPGFVIVREAIAAGITVIPIPGACAAIAAVIASGLPPERFIFENFLPPKSGRRRALIESFKNERRSIVFYESPHRIEKVLKDMAELIPLADVSIARELTKMHEEFLRGTPAELLERFAKKPPKGEMVVVVNTRKMMDASEDSVDHDDTEE